MIKVILDIAGMRCGSCAVGIELMLGKKNGVKNAKVSLTERTAVVEYDPVITSTPDIINTIKDIGYIATMRTGQ